MLHYNRVNCLHLCHVHFSEPDIYYSKAGKVLMQTANLKMILSMAGYSNFVNDIAYKTTQCPISSQTDSRSHHFLLWFDTKGSCDHSIKCCSLSFI